MTKLGRPLKDDKNIWVFSVRLDEYCTNYIKHIQQTYNIDKTEAIRRIIQEAGSLDPSYQRIKKKGAF